MRQVLAARNNGTKIKLRDCKINAKTQTKKEKLTDLES